MVQKSEDGCWLWTGHVRGGYGRLKVNGSHVQAHRFSWVVHCGDIPAGCDVLHRCDNPPCVRPDHLFLGDAKMNVADMFSKGRGNRARGERAGGAKLSEKDVTAIRAARKAGMSAARIATAYAVSAQTVHNILRGATWRHVP